MDAHLLSGASLIVALEYEARVSLGSIYRVLTQVAVPLESLLIALRWAPQWQCTAQTTISVPK
jgi:hypothetical protein